jgi:hypothetical protein
VRDELLMVDKCVSLCFSDDSYKSQIPKGAQLDTNTRLAVNQYLSNKPDKVNKKYRLRLWISFLKQAKMSLRILIKNLFFLSRISEFLNQKQ